MAEVRPIDANALLEEMKHPLKYETSESDTDIDVYMRIVKNAPTLDYEPVVHCKDCVQNVQRYGLKVCTILGRQTSDNFYCSYGAKMDEEVKE